MQQKRVNIPGRGRARSSNPMAMMAQLLGGFGMRGGGRGRGGFPFMGGRGRGRGGFRGRGGPPGGHDNSSGGPQDKVQTE